MDFAPVTNALVAAAALAVTTLAGLAIPMLPRVARWLVVSVNGVDTTLLRAAIDNAAEVAFRQVRDGHPMQVAIGGMADYVHENLPDTLKRVGVSDETLGVMCRGALARLMADRAVA